MCQIFHCFIIQGVGFNYHQRNVRSQASVSNFQVSVSAFMTKSRSRLEIWARSRSRRLRSRLHHCRLLRFLEENNFFQRRALSKAFFHCPNARMRTKRMLFAKMHLQGHKVEEYKNKIGAQLEELQARFYHFQELKSCFAFLINPFIVNVVSDSYPVRQPFVTNLCAVETKLTGS